VHTNNYSGKLLITKDHHLAMCLPSEVTPNSSFVTFTGILKLNAVTQQS